MQETRATTAVIVKMTSRPSVASVHQTGKGEHAVNLQLYVSQTHVAMVVFVLIMEESPRVNAARVLKAVTVRLVSILPYFLGLQQGRTLDQILGGGGASLLF